MLSGAMVIGLPLAPFNRVRRMVIEYFRHKFGEEGEFISYTLPAMNRAQQALGRVLRTPEDRGVLVFGERRFLEPRVRNALPEWMRAEMVNCTGDTFRGGDRRMETISGSCHFGLWYDVHVWWSGHQVARVRFDHPPSRTRPACRPAIPRRQDADAHPAYEPWQLREIPCMHGFTGLLKRYPTAERPPTGRSQHVQGPFHGLSRQ